METVSETCVSNDCQMIPELSDKQKKISRKKKKKSKKHGNELKNNDSHITSQNGNNADEDFSSGKKKEEGETDKSTSEDQVQLSENRLSTLPAESCQRDSVSCEEPGATLHHKDPVFSSREDSLPDADRNGSIKKITKRKGKKKKEESASCEERMLEDTEKITKEDKVHLSNNPLSNIIIQEGSQLEATKMTSSQKRKRKRERDTNALKETGVDVHSTTAEVTAKYNNISEAEGSKSMSKEEKSVASVITNSCLKSKDDTGEQREGTNVKLNETVAQTQIPKAKKRKKRKTNRMESNDGNAGRELVSNLASQKETSGEENSFPKSEKTKEKKIDDNAEAKEDVLEVKHNPISEAEGSKSMSLEEKSVGSVVIESCVKSKDDTVEERECTDIKLNENVAQAQSSKAKKRKKRKTKTMKVCDSLGNTLESQRENSATGEENSFNNLEETKKRETDDNIEVKEDVLEVKHSTISEAEASKSMILEEKSGSSVVIDSCVKSKYGTVEQQECTDVKLNESVVQPQSPKAKKKKKRKTKTVEVSDPLVNIFPTSTKSEPVECVENKDGNAGREFMNYSASPSEKIATGEERGSQNIETSKEKETDENTEVKEEILGAGACDVIIQKRKGKKKKMSSVDHKSADMEVCDPTGSVECLLDHSNKEDMQNCDGNAGQEFGGEDMKNKIEKSATKEESGVQKSGKRRGMTKDENIESNQDALGAEGVSDVERKRHKRKSKRNSNSESVAIMDSEAVQYSDENSVRETASKDLANILEDSATMGERVGDVENGNKSRKDKKEEVDQDALGAEVVSKDEAKTKKSKKKKNSLDHKTDYVEDVMKKDIKGEVEQNSLGVEGGSKVEVKTEKSKKQKRMIDDNKEEKDDVSLPRNDEEPEIDREKLETSLSSSVLIQNNVAKEVASSETGDVPRCSCEGQQRTRKLLIFDLNGILADIVQGYTGQFVPDGKVSYRSVFRRPFVSSFLDFCFEKFEVGIWSSRRIGLDYMVDIVMKNYSRNLLFCFDQNNCTTTKFKTQEKNDKPLFLKDLKRVWDRFGTCISCGKRKFDETNTLLVDDSPDKAVCNPPHTGIFPCPYQYTDSKDSSLGPEGDLRNYLERLVNAENVQKFVTENPFGQAAITETHESWEFYSKVVEAHK